MALIFENVPCSRCGGSGHYSYCTMHGTRCFKCSGNKFMLTKRGAVAQAFFREKMMLPVEEVKPGDVVEYIDMGGGRMFCRVESIYSCLLNKGLVSFELSHKGKPVVSYQVYAGHKFRMAQSAENKARYVAEALEYQASLGKNGKPLKRKAKEAA